MKSFTWTVTVTVDATWVEDGFDLNNPATLQSMEDGFLPWASSGEKNLKVVKSPDRRAVARIQGYPTVKAMADAY